MEWEVLEVVRKDCLKQKNWEDVSLQFYTL